MKKNAKQNLALAAAVVILLNFSSCGKYEEGPGPGHGGSTPPPPPPAQGG